LTTKNRPKKRGRARSVLKKSREERRPRGAVRIIVRALWKKRVEGGEEEKPRNGGGRRKATASSSKGERDQERERHPSFMQTGGKKKKCHTGRVRACRGGGGERSKKSKKGGVADRAKVTNQHRVSGEKKSRGGATSSENSTRNAKKLNKGGSEKRSHLSKMCTGG